MESNSFSVIIKLLNLRKLCNRYRFDTGVYRSGQVYEYATFVENANAVEARVAVAADLLSLTVLTPPGEWGADIVVGTTQRFGIPMGYGGPHAGYFATSEKYKRNIPGRIITLLIPVRLNFSCF